MQFSISAAPKGFYVPNTAVTLTGNTPTVYRVEDGVARATTVELLQTVDANRRIQGKGISSGTHIIVGGVHYVSDGQPVSVTEVIK